MSLAISPRRLARAYLLEARFECLRMMRSPIFTILALVMPLLMYAFLGVYLDCILDKAPPAKIATVFGHWCVFSVMWPGMFGFGASVAIERDQGLLALKRAMPVPLAAYLFAKALMSVLFGAIASILVAAACALFTQSSLTFGQYAEAIAISTLGALLFAAIGLFVGSRATAQHVTGMMYLVYIPVMLLAGLFFPVPQAIKLVSPAFYLDQLLAYRVGGAATGSQLAYVAILVALTALLTALSIRRLTKNATTST